MSKKIMKNIEMAKALVLAELVNYQQGQVVSKTLVQNDHVSLTLFAFDREEKISSHSSEGDAMVCVLDGTAEITIGGEKFTLSAGETIVMPAGVTHAVYAPQKMKFMLTVVFYMLRNCLFPILAGRCLRLLLVSALYADCIGSPLPILGWSFGV